MGQEEQIHAELVARAKEGDEGAFKSLLDAYEPLISSLVNQYAGPAMSAVDREDLHAEAVSAFCDALRHYRLEMQSKVTFGRYAKTCIHNRMVSELRRINKQHRHEINMSEKEEELSRCASGSDPTRRIREKENLSALRAAIDRELSPYERRIWWLYMAGASAQEIAEKVGEERKSVENAVYRIRRKLRTLLA